MPRPAKPPRLLLRKRQGREPIYVILDHGQEISTGCGLDRRAKAEKRLADYISEKWENPSPGSRETTIADVLTIYAREHAPTVAAPATIGYAIEALIPFWGERLITEINGKACRQYAEQRGVADGTVRRELGVLRAALNYCVKEGYLLAAPVVALPKMEAPRDRWLTRSEVASLLRAARKSPTTRHLCKFILIAIYTGTRKSAILKLGWEPSKDAGHIDLARGLLYRSGSGERQTNKRRTPARLPRQLALHARLWRKNSANHVIEYQGRRLRRIQTSWRNVCEEASIKDATPHTLKHTAITWAMQNGADPTQAAGYFATSLETIQRVYLHHHPEFQKSAVDAIERKSHKK